MATRSSSRRSGGAESLTLNPAIMGLLPQARLKEECVKRGLPTEGNKEILLMRLEDFMNGVVYASPVVPVAAAASTGSTPSTSRHASTDNTPKSRPNSAKGAPPKRTPRRKNSVAAATGEAESTAEAEISPPKKKPRRNSTKKELLSPEIVLPPKEEEIFEDEISVTIVTAPADSQFDSDDDQPLIRPKEEAAVVVVKADPIEEVVLNEEDEEKVSKKKKRRRQKEEDDIESGAVLAKGDSEWVPPEESEKRVTRDSTKRTRRNTEIKHEDSDHESSPSASMPKLDPEIYDQDSHDDDEQAKKAKARTDAQRKSSAGDGEKKLKKEAIDRPRTTSITATSGTPAAAAAGKDKRKESASTPAAPPRPKEKPATQVYAELMMAQKKAKEAAAAAAAAASATTASNGVGGAPGTPVTTAAATVAKRDSQEKEMSGGASPVVTTGGKPDPSSRRDSIVGGGAAAPGTPTAVAVDGAAPSPRPGFSMMARKNAPPRPVVTLPSADSSDLLGDLLGKQQVLLEKKVRSTAETEQEKIRIVTQMKQREIREETVVKEKERLQREKREKEERERARLERERKEKEAKMSVISAPSRPIPPPPPPPPVPVLKQHDNSPVPRASPPAEGGAVMDAAAAEAALEELKEEPMDISPVYEPLEENGDEEQKGRTVAAATADYEPEYEPLSAGPSMPSLDRSIADAHHRQRAQRAKGRENRDHSLMAPEVPFSADEPFLLRLAEKMKMVERQRNTSPPAPVSDEIRECMEELLKKVDAKVEKEMKWERRTKRKSEYQVEREKEEEKKRAQMMRDPRALLAKATNILENMGSIDEEASNSPTSAGATAAISAIHISQDLAEPGTYDEDTVDRPLPEFHGEPVPSDDDEALFLEAAGLPRKDKKPKHPVVEEEAPPSHEHILMDYYNACLHIKSATDKPWLIDPDNENGLALMWGGVRTNHGYLLPWREEKKCLVFQIKIVEHQSIRHIPFNEQEPHDVRVGFSLRASPNIMGEAPLSWAFSTMGKKCVNNAFQEWGDPIEIGDIVTAVFDFSAKCISFYKNETCMGVAFRDIVLPEEDDALYAHVCVKNCKVAVNLGEFPAVEGGWGLAPTPTAEGVLQEGQTAPALPTPAAAGLLVRDPEWAFPTEIERKRYEMSRLPPGEKASCTLLMMVGLPGVGKSTWVRQYIRDHPEEKWDVINAEAVMGAMKVNGVNRGRAHTGRWDMVLGLVAKALQKMVLLAARRRRNYIVDLSNVNKDSRKRRLMHFTEFTKKCIVIVPDEEEMVNRQMKQTRQEGASHVPAEAILEMKAVFTFPTEEAEGFDEVHLIEPAMPRIAEAIEIIQRFNDEGKPWYQKRYRGRGSRRGGRGGYMGGGGGDRRGSDFNRPLSVSTQASNGSGPPTNVGAGRPSPGAWGMGESPSGPGHFSWASRKSSN